MKTRELIFPPHSWLHIFFPSREWWQRRMWRLPILQIEVSYTTPRDAEGKLVPWWFPSVYAGMNAVQPHRGRSLNAWVDWLGLFAGVGVFQLRRSPFAEKNAEIKREERERTEAQS